MNQLTPVVGVGAIEAALPMSGRVVANELETQRRFASLPARSFKFIKCKSLCNRLNVENETQILN